MPFIDMIHDGIDQMEFDPAIFNILRNASSDTSILSKDAYTYSIDVYERVASNCF